MKIQLFIPCFIDQLAPQVGVATYELLVQLGCEVLFPYSQTCCGQAACNAGHEKKGLAISKYFFRHFSPNYPTVTPSSSCAAFVRTAYNQLYGNKLKDSHYKNTPFFPIYELTDFVVSELQKTNFSHISFPHKIVYHSSCASLREYKTETSLQQLLSTIDGLEILTTDAPDECCGFGGSFSVSFSAIAHAMASRKMSCARKTNATYITSLDMSCLLHLQRTPQLGVEAIQPIHIAEILLGKTSPVSS